jgi:DNA-binding response OmpR family regulator
MAGWIKGEWNGIPELPTCRYPAEVPCAANDKLDGFEAARRIREQARGEIVLIALTGWGQEEDRRRSREAGFDHHLTKPIDFQILEALIAGLKPTRQN